MSTVNTNIADYLSRVEDLTKSNLEILKTLNDSFLTKKNHLIAEVNDTTYVIPSFISLENKINMLQENFENLVHAPETSEAYFNFDGNTRSIEVRKYSHVPNSVKLNTVAGYEVFNNDIFKDFMNPVPYINLDLPSVPNDITDINVKKIIPISSSLKNAFAGMLNNTPSISVSYRDINKILINYTEDVDYTEYDTVYKMPIRKNIGTGTYVIESVLSDVINDDLEEIITLKLRNDLTSDEYMNTLTYRVFDESIEKYLQKGDHLINFDGTGKVEIVNVKSVNNVIVVKVVNGEYLNFLGTDSYDSNNDTDIHDLSKLRFYSAVDFDADKNIKVPLEYDQYVFIAAAPINSRMNLQSSWGTGLIIDSYALKNSNEGSFETYYNNNVKNLGDVLYEITSMTSDPLSKLSPETFEHITSIKPTIPVGSLSVMQINNHLNNSTTVKNIRDAYNQKKHAEQELLEIHKKIDETNSQLAEISFDDISGIRQIHLSKLTELRNKENEIVNTINNSIEKISINVNSAEIPIENAKYRIRGFYVPDFENDINDHVIGIKVQYRYKNMSSEIGNAVSINGKDSQTYIYSDWNDLKTFNRSKIAKCIDGVYSCEYELPNETKNEPSYNQIDIPISQGESVDIRLKLLYNYGYPYVDVMSNWSEIINIKFPEEFSKDVPILSIIEENNNDIESNRFNNILNNTGVTTHINDVIVDQNITYYHKPDNISSGFYTDERRIIPLKDKLLSMSNDIALLKSEIINSADNCKVSLIVGDSNIVLYSDRDNNITLEPYNSFIGENVTDNVNEYAVNDGVVSVMMNIAISNTGDTPIKLYSIFPGNRDTLINNSKASYISKDQYCVGANGGVWFKYSADENKTKLQTQNQFIAFRVKDAWSGENYYEENVSVSTDRMQNSGKISEIYSDDKLGMILYPYISNEHDLCIDSDNVKSYMIINPKEEIFIPIHCSYVASEANSKIQKTMSFDIRTSLYSEPINYSFNVIGKNTSSVQDKLSITNKRKFWDRFAGTVKYNSSIN